MTTISKLMCTECLMEGHIKSDLISDGVNCKSCGAPMKVVKEDTRKAVSTNSIDELLSGYLVHAQSRVEMLEEMEVERIRSLEDVQLKLKEEKEKIIELKKFFE